MRILIIFLGFFCLIAFNSIASDKNIIQLRKLLSMANTNKVSAKEYYNTTRTIAQNEPAIFLGFKAIADLIMCKYVSGPINKLSHFKNGKNLLEIAIKKEPNNTELRFMRLCTQANCPSILGYNDDIEDDKNHLIQYLSSQKQLKAPKDPDLYDNIKLFLKESEVMSESEKLSMSKF